MARFKSSRATAAAVFTVVVDDDDDDDDFRVALTEDLVCDGADEAGSAIEPFSIVAERFSFFLFGGPKNSAIGIASRDSSSTTASCKSSCAMASESRLSGSTSALAAVAVARKSTSSWVDNASPVTTSKSLRKRTATAPMMKRADRAIIGRAYCLQESGVESGVESGLDGVVCFALWNFMDEIDYRSGNKANSITS